MRSFVLLVLALAAAGCVQSETACLDTGDPPSDTGPQPAEPGPSFPDYGGGPVPWPEEHPVCVFKRTSGQHVTSSQAR
jgi:hypothetical protein